MRRARPEGEKPQPPSKAKLKLLQERAARGLPLFTDNDDPNCYEENAAFRNLSALHRNLDLYLTCWKEHELDPDFEIKFPQIARIIDVPNKPSRCPDLLPESSVKWNRRHVWRWKEVRLELRKLMIRGALKRLADSI